MIDNIYKTGKNLLRTVPCQTNLLIKVCKKKFAQEKSGRSKVVFALRCKPTTMIVKAIMQFPSKQIVAYIHRL